MSEITINLTDEQTAAIIKKWFIDNVHREAKYRDNETGRIIKHFVTEDGNWKNKPRGKITKTFSNNTNPNSNSPENSKNILSKLIQHKTPSTTEL